MVQALRSVKNLVRLDPKIRFDVIQQKIEICRIRFVAADILRSVNSIKRNSEFSIRCSEAITVNVGKNDKLEVFFQNTKCIGGIWKCWPVRY